MSVHRPAVLAGALLLGVTCLGAAHPVESDPHELYEKAREHLANGELRSAGTALSRLHTLIAERPDWDPEHIFANELLPPLQARLKRLQGVARKLDDFTVRALRDLQPPEISDDISTVRDYTAWATSVIQGLRGERDRIIRAELTDAEEAAFVTQTESFSRTERLLETDVLQRMAETAGDDILGLLSGDPRLESVLARFRQLKRQLMQIVAERDQVEQRLAKSRERHEAALRALAAVVTGVAPPTAGVDSGRPVNVADHYARFLDGELEALRHRTSLTTAEREALRASLGRSRWHNEVLAAAGIGSNQSDRIEALAQAVEALPLEDGLFIAAPAAGRVYLSLAGALVLTTGLLGWWVFARRRRLAAVPVSGARRGPVVSAGVRGADAGPGPV